MGIRYRYKCENCEYEAVVSGGLDQGITNSTHTIVCNECRELSDIQINKKNKMKWVQEDINVDGLICPKCHGKNIKLWNDANHIAKSITIKNRNVAGCENCICPKCDSSMERGDAVIFWD